MKKECIAMLLAGGQGSRLHVLTSRMAKPALPFGGKYRIIDFPLSNCVNSGIDTVGVLTQYQPLELSSYIGIGEPWDLDRAAGGVHILPPYMKEGSKGTWYQGTANAVYQNIGFIAQYQPDYVLILSGDHVYKMDYSSLLARHKETGAACTIAALEVPWAEASRFGILTPDEQDMVETFYEKPAHPNSNLASMGIYVFTWSKLRDYLTADEKNPQSSHDFGKDVIPALLQAGEKLAIYRFSGYWKDVGTIVSFWDANMDALSVRSGIQLYDPAWPIYCRTPTYPPHRMGPEAIASHALIANGCTIHGTVENSILFSSVTVEKGAVVRYSILMPGTVVESGAVVEYAILAEQVRIGAGARIGAPPQASPPDTWGVAVLGAHVTIGAHQVIPPNAMLSEEVLG